MNTYLLPEISGSSIFYCFNRVGCIGSMVAYHLSGFFLALCLEESRSWFCSRYCFAFGYFVSDISFPSLSYGLSRYLPPHFIVSLLRSCPLITGSKRLFSTKFTRFFEIKILSAPVAMPMPILNPCASISLNPCPCVLNILLQSSS